MPWQITSSVCWLSPQSFLSMSSVPGVRTGPAGSWSPGLRPRLTPACRGSDCLGFAPNQPAQHTAVPIKVAGVRCVHPNAGRCPGPQAVMGQQSLTRLHTARAVLEVGEKSRLLSAGVTGFLPRHAHGVRGGKNLRTWAAAGLVMGGGAVFLPWCPGRRLSEAAPMRVRASEFSQAVPPGCHAEVGAAGSCRTGLLFWWERPHRGPSSAYVWVCFPTQSLSLGAEQSHAGEGSGQMSRRHCTGLTAGAGMSRRSRVSRAEGPAQASAALGPKGGCMGAPKDRGHGHPKCQGSRRGLQAGSLWHLICAELSSCWLAVVLQAHAWGPGSLAGGGVQAWLAVPWGC